MVYNDILLDTDGDIRLDECGDAIPTNSLVQDINIHLKWFLGEWPFDESKGMDWYGEAFVKNPDIDRLSRIIRKAIESRNGIIAVEKISIEMDSKKRTASISWAARTDQGTLESEVRLWGNTA